MTESLPENLTVEEYERALDFSKLASKTYDWDDWKAAEIGMNFFRGIDDIKKQDFHTGNYKIITRGGNKIDWWIDDDAGLDFVVFRNTKTKHIVLAFRGTEPLSVEDWVHNLKQHVAGSSEQYEQAVKLAEKMSKDAKKKGIDFFLTGHSLGGGLATAAALKTGAKAIVFDAAGISKSTIKELGLNEANGSNIINFNVQDCFVSDWNKKMDQTALGNGIPGESKQYGKQIWLESVSDRADFKLLPEWSRTVKVAESILNHAWHVFTYQLENKKFVNKLKRFRVSEPENGGDKRRKLK